jgi:hypothetical protein
LIKKSKTKERNGMDMKKLLIVLGITLAILVSNTQTLAGGTSALKFFYLVKEFFPDKEHIAVLIDKNSLDAQMNSINRASAQMKVKVTIHPIENAFDIGKAIKKIDNGSALVIFDAPVFEDNKNKLYILSKAKEKQVAVFSSSQSYSESGAFMGCIAEGDATKLILNFKYSENLKSSYDDAFLEKIGISQVIS